MSIHCHRLLNSSLFQTLQILKLDLITILQIPNNSLILLILSIQLFILGIQNHLCIFFHYIVYINRFIYKNFYLHDFISNHFMTNFFESFIRDFHISLHNSFDWFFHNLFYINWSFDYFINQDDFVLNSIYLYLHKSFSFHLSGYSFISNYIVNNFLFYWDHNYFFYYDIFESFHRNFYVFTDPFFNWNFDVNFFNNFYLSYLLYLNIFIFILKNNILNVNISRNINLFLHKNFFINISDRRSRNNFIHINNLFNLFILSVYDRNIYILNLLDDFVYDSLSVNWFLHIFCFWNFNDFIIRNLYLFCNIDIFRNMNLDFFDYLVIFILYLRNISVTL